MRRIVITLAGDEFSALHMFAQNEQRDPRAQAVIIIRRALERRGMLANRERIHNPPKPRRTTKQAASAMHVVE